MFAEAMAFEEDEMMMDMAVEMAPRIRYKNAAP